MNAYLRSFLRFCAIVVFCPAFTQELPKVTPPTPNAASIFKYLEHPVNYSTGIPSISIPIYEVKSGSIILPITLNYHSSGRRVYDETGAVGLGWTLNAGGMISRTIYGEADDNDNFIKFPTPWKKQADIDPMTAAGADYLEGVVSTSYPIPWYDTEYDYFSYSANSISGKFILRDDNNVKVPVLIPKKPYRVEYHKVTIQSNVNYFDYINIIDDKGTLYRFGQSIKDGEEYHESSNSGAVGKTGWMLTEIISADKVDTVFFKYQVFVKTKRTITQKTVIIDGQSDCYYGGESVSATDCDGEEDGTGTANDQTNSIQRLTEIRFRNGQVTFNLHTGSDLISSITIKNIANEVIKLVQFEQSNQDAISDGNAPAKRLDLLTITNENTEDAEKYVFEYYPTTYTNSFVVDVRFRDLWGYYNASGQIDMRPVVTNVDCWDVISTQYVTIGDPTSIRTPSLAGTTSGVLRKIIFPTGGTKEFIYELNKYWDPVSSQVQECGGLRLSQTLATDGTGQTLHKTYKYGLTESGYGTLPFIPRLSNMSFETKHMSYNTTSGNTYADLSYRQRVYNADVLPIFGEFLNKPVHYEEVVEYHGTVAANTGKTVYKYDKGNLFTMPNSVQGLFANSDLKHWKENSLIEKTEYRNVGGQYDRVKKTTNTYLETVYNDEKIWGLHVGKLFFKSPSDVNDWTGQSVPTYRYSSDGCSGDGLDVFRFSDYTISIGKKELVRSIDSLFFYGGAHIVTATDFTYNDHHLLENTSVIASNGDTLKTETKYPFDFLSDPIYTLMEQRNMVNFEIEQSKFSNSTFLSSLHTQYRDWGNYIIKPDTISFRKGANPYEPRVFIHAYDPVGNVQSVSKDNGPRLSYIYGHNHELLLAEVKNANANDIFHTSFEDGTGNSVDGDAKTGRRSRTGGFSRTLTGLTNQTYKLTYFQKVSGKWQPMEISNISVTSGSYAINVTGQVDEVRFCPQNALMTTYTYTPLKGLLSITDANSFSTYFEYDSLNRLKIEKDDEGNISKRYTYHYKAQ